MSDFELAVVSPQTFQAPILIERASPSTRKKFFEFFTVPIRNANTIVHSGHGAQYDPEAIREVERILKENLTDKN
jgi:hypothetical protein